MEITVTKPQISWKILIAIIIPGIIGVLVLAIGTTYTIPQLAAQLGEDSPPPPDIVIILGMLVQLGAFVTLATWGGLSLAAQMKVNVTPILKDGLSDMRLLWGLIAGIVSGLLMLAAHQLIFFPIIEIPVNVSAEMPPLLGVASAFLYGGFTEEILIRLGLMTLFLWFAGKIQGDENGVPSTTMFWIVNIIITVIFALLHLPSAILIQGVELTPIVVIQALVLNSVSILFGWLYWNKGIETAFAAHIGVHVGYTLLATLVL